MRQETGSSRTTVHASPRSCIGGLLGGVTAGRGCRRSVLLHSSQPAALQAIHPRPLSAPLPGCLPQRVPVGPRELRHAAQQPGQQHQGGMGRFLPARARAGRLAVHVLGRGRRGQTDCRGGRPTGGRLFTAVEGCLRAAQRARARPAAAAPRAPRRRGLLRFLPSPFLPPVQDYAWFQPVWDSYTTKVLRGDAARYFIMHKHGGLCECRWAAHPPKGPHRESPDVASGVVSGVVQGGPRHAARDAPPLPLCSSSAAPLTDLDMDVQCYREGYDLLEGKDVVLQARTGGSAGCCPPSPRMVAWHGSNTPPAPPRHAPPRPPPPSPPLRPAALHACTHSAVAAAMRARRRRRLPHTPPPPPPPPGAGHAPQRGAHKRGGGQRCGAPLLALPLQSHGGAQGRAGRAHPRHGCVGRGPTAALHACRRRPAALAAPRRLAHRRCRCPPQRSLACPLPNAGPGCITEAMVRLKIVELPPPPPEGAPRAALRCRRRSSTDGQPAVPAGWAGRWLGGASASL